MKEKLEFRGQRPKNAGVGLESLVSNEHTNWLNTYEWCQLAYTLGGICQAMYAPKKEIHDKQQWDLSCKAYLWPRVQWSTSLNSSISLMKARLLVCSEAFPLILMLQL